MISKAGGMNIVLQNKAHFSLQVKIIQDLVTMSGLDALTFYMYLGKRAVSENEKNWSNLP